MSGLTPKGVELGRLRDEDPPVDPLGRRTP